MEKLILIKYGELTTKKANRKFFVKILYDNLKEKLSDLDVVIRRDLSRMYIEYNSDNEKEILNKLNQVFGIYTYQIAYKVKPDKEIISDTLKELIKEKTGTFKVETNRVDKNFEIDSLTFSRMMGAVILKSNQNLTVDVHNPDFIVNIEILNSCAYIFMDKYYGLGGYPVGSQKKAMCMLSGGIDSPVACYLALKRGIKIECVYFEAIPHTSLEARNKVIELTKVLTDYQASIKLHIVPFTKIQEAIYKNCKDDYVITIMRRMMYRIMERISHKYKAKAIVNGESIGQVASQTLTSMEVINSVTNIPVIRPVACLDKLEIMDLANKINTYNISILPYEDCCTVFVPKHPVINPDINVSIYEESKFDYETLISDAIYNINTLIIDKNYNDHSDLL